jgi:hypothetical protein
MKLIVPGYVYRFCIDGSQVPEEEHWPEPKIRTHGRGCQYIYEVSTEEHRWILEQIEDVAVLSSTGADEEVMNTARRILRWLKNKGN